MATKISVQRLGADRIVLRHSRGAELRGLIYTVAVFSGWYWLLLGQPRSWSALVEAAPVRGGLGTWFFLLAPLLSVPRLWTSIKVVRGRLLFEFDKGLQVVKKDGVRLCAFEEIERVQLRTIQASESADEFRLSLVKKEGSKLALAQTADEAAAFDAAEDIANLIGVPWATK